MGPEARQLVRRRQATALAHRPRAAIRAPKAVIGFWPCNSVGDDVEVYEDESRARVRARFCMLRQQGEKPEGEKQLCLADFVAPKASGRLDFMGGFVVTTGAGVESFAEHFKQELDDYSAIMAQALGDRLAEALAEPMHKRDRALCGFGRTEDLPPDQLLKERYRGIRPAPGYPALPQSHREVGAVRPARSDCCYRRLTDGIDGDDAGEQRLGLVLQPPRGPVLRHREAVTRTGRGLRAAQGHADSGRRAVAGAKPGLRAGALRQPQGVPRSAARPPLRTWRRCDWQRREAATAEPAGRAASQKPAGRRTLICGGLVPPPRLRYSWRCDDKDSCHPHCPDHTGTEAGLTVPSEAQLAG